MGFMEWLRRLFVPTVSRPLDPLRIDPILEPVPHTFLLTGYAPPGVPVQILVHAHDNQWYLQADPVRQDDQWAATVRVGQPDSGGQYEIIAVSGRRLKRATYVDLRTELPFGVQISKPLIVTRRHAQTW